MTNTKARGRLNGFAGGIRRIAVSAPLEMGKRHCTESRSPIGIKRAETQATVGPFYRPLSLAREYKDEAAKYVGCSSCSPPRKKMV